MTYSHQHLDDDEDENIRQQIFIWIFVNEVMTENNTHEKNFS